METTRAALAAGLGLAVLVGGAAAGGGHSHGGGHDHGGGHGHPHAAAESHGHHEAPDPRQALASHGGEVLGKGERLFEVTFSDAGVRVYPMDAEGRPAPVAGAGGTVYLRGRRGRRTRLSLRAVPGTENAPGHLEATEDLSEVPDGSRTAMFSLQGFGEGEGQVSVWTRFERTHRPEDHHEGDGAGHPEDHGHGGHSHGDHGHRH